MNKKLWGSLGVAAAYVCWGVLTVFWNLLGAVNSVYVLSQRIIWSMVFMGLFMAATGKWKEIAPVFRNHRQFLICFASGILITINWGVYIFAVSSGHVLDASLGYFIEPVLVGAIGLLIFRERPSRLETVTFLFALAGVVYMILRSGTIPVLALLISGSFAVYGAVKKNLDISPYASLFMETLCMTPFALLFALWADNAGMGSIGVLHGAEFFLLPACGIITSVPLLLFNIGVKEIPYYISGILMYINPTLQFLMGLFYFHEELDQNKLAAFCLIWFGIIFTVVDHLRQMRLHKRETT
ncbi:MAG: EamA family transporter RarD [Lachnospiraceae bacterium]|nr:EamA family transporter RarD [Lachnospiraceae bacterium]